MLRRCLACHRESPPNDEIEHLPIGRRTAYDPHRGRLWVICSWCGHWSLAPIDRRWEALEELERAVRDRGRLLARTDRIGLVTLRSIEVVRVGESGLREEAWWRYGKTLRGRRLRYGVVTAVGGSAAVTITVGALVGLLAIPGVGDVAAFSRWKEIKRLPREAMRIGGEAALGLDRRLRYGGIAWQGGASCARCGRSITELSFRERGRLIVEPGGSMRVRCYRCGDRAEAGYRIDGVEAAHLLRRVLAYENQPGATEDELERAVERLDRSHADRGLVSRVAAEPLVLGMGSKEDLLALELAANEEIERTLSALDAPAVSAGRASAALQRNIRWRTFVPRTRGVYLARGPRVMRRHWAVTRTLSPRGGPCFSASLSPPRSRRSPRSRAPASTASP